MFALIHTVAHVCFLARSFVLRACFYLNGLCKTTVCCKEMYNTHHYSTH